MPERIAALLADCPFAILQDDAVCSVQEGKVNEGCKVRAYNKKQTSRAKAMGTLARQDYYIPQYAYHGLLARCGVLLASPLKHDRASAQMPTPLQPNERR